MKIRTKLIFLLLTISVVPFGFLAWFTFVTTQEFVIGAMGLSLLPIVIIFAIWLANDFSKPIRQLQQGAEAIGNGNLDYRVGSEREDELGVLANALDAMARNLKTALASRQELNREIEERKDAEKRLQKSEELVRYWLNETTDGVWDWNLKTDEEYMSPRWKELFGYREEEIENHASSWRK